MALFHLSVTQTKRSAGQSAIASAAYRAGERLYSEYYGEYSDYTRKGGVILPPDLTSAQRNKNSKIDPKHDRKRRNYFYPLCPCGLPGGSGAGRDTALNEIRQPL